MPVIHKTDFEGATAKQQYPWVTLGGRRNGIHPKKEKKERFLVARMVVLSELCRKEEKEILFFSI